MFALEATPLLPLQRLLPIPPPLLPLPPLQLPLPCHFLLRSLLLLKQLCLLPLPCYLHSPPPATVSPTRSGSEPDDPRASHCPTFCHSLRSPSTNSLWFCELPPAALSSAAWQSARMPPAALRPSPASPPATTSPAALLPAVTLPSVPRAKECPTADCLESICRAVARGAALRRVATRSCYAVRPDAA